MTSLQSVVKTWEVEFCATLFYMDKDGSSNRGRRGNEKQPAALENILLQFEEVFVTPTRLPLERSQNHAIRIRDGCGPIQVRPYWYAHCQKDEIEKLEADMLKTGVIQPSQSPYSSSVLLVKKKIAVGGFVWTIVH